MDTEESWWWLSFAGEDGFRGVAIVGPADNIGSAAILASLNGVNPGGEVLGFPFPDDLAARLEDGDTFTLLTEDAAKALDARMADS